MAKQAQGKLELLDQHQQLVIGLMKNIQKEMKKIHIFFVVFKVVKKEIYYLMHK